MVDLIELLSGSTPSACEAQIHALTTDLSDDVVAWEETLVALASAAFQSFDLDCMWAIWVALPPGIREDFFKRILATASYSPCIKTFIQFILDDATLEPQHLAGMVNELLNSPVVVESDELNALLSRINPQMLVSFYRSLVLEPGVNQSEDKNNPHQIKYESVLTALSIHASRSEFTFLSLVDHDPHLANLIAIWRISHAENDSQMEPILRHVLKNGCYYNWQDKAFLKVVLPKFLTLLDGVAQDQAKLLFNQYMGLNHQFHPSTEDKIRFLDNFYQHKGSTDKVIAWIHSASEFDPGFIINFLTGTKINSSIMNRGLLKLIPENELPGFAGHILALKTIWSEDHALSSLFEDFIWVICEGIKQSRDQRHSLEQFAKAAQYLPELALEQLMQEMTSQLSAYPNIQLEWLNAAVQNFSNQNLILPYCTSFLCKNEKTKLSFQPVLEALSSELLVELFVLMVREKAPVGAYQCFELLFTRTERQPQLFYLLVTVPVINSQLLTRFVDLLDDKTILTLIDELLLKSQENSELKTTLNQVLLAFCQRLTKTRQVKDPIHQWANTGFTPSMVQSLLESPDCVHELSLTQSRLGAWVGWNSLSDALVLRIDRVLNSSLLDDAAVKGIALAWLGHFRSSPERLKLIFENLEQSKVNRDEIGRQNYDRIKVECWGMLRERQTYQEELFNSFVQSLAQPGVFDPFLQKLAIEEGFLKNPTLGAQFLALTHDAIPDAMSDEVLSVLLIHSVHEDNAINWSKASQFLSHKPIAQKVGFITQLIDRVEKAHFNPELIRRTYDLMTKTNDFERAFTQLAEHHWRWLVRHASVADLNGSLLHWLDLIIQHHGIEGFNLGRLLMYLPKEEALIRSILSSESIKTPKVLARLFVQLSNCDDDATQMLGYVQERILQCDERWILNFVERVLNAVQAETVNSMAIQILNITLLTLAEKLSPRNFAHVKLVQKQLKLLSALLYSEKSLDKAEIRQLMLSLVSRISQHDLQWATHLMGSPAFTSMVLDLLQSGGTELEKTYSYQALIELFIGHGLDHLQPKLKNNESFQLFIVELLKTPPVQLNRDCYILFFNQLRPSYQLILSRFICEKGDRYPIHNQVFPLLSKTLSIEVLANYFEINKNDTIILEAIYVHPDGVKRLNQVTRHQLIAGMRSGEQIQKLLEAQIPVSSRLAFVEELFERFQGDKDLFSNQLAVWRINLQSIASLANFTQRPSDKRLLDEVISEKPYYQAFIHEFIHQPTLDIQLNTGSYLEDRVIQALTDPMQSQLADSKWLKQMPADVMVRALKQQFVLGLEWQAFQNLLKPFSNCSEVAGQAVIAARWIHQLGIYNDGLLEGFAYHLLTTEPLTQELIEQTDLYQLILCSFFDPSLKNSTVIERSKSLPQWLDAYATQLESVDIKQSERVRLTLNLYQKKLDLIKCFSSLKWFNLFRPDYVMPSNFNEGDKQDLIVASDEGFETRKRFNTQLQALFSIAFNEKQLSGHDEFNTWLFDKVLMSPMSFSISQHDLQVYLQSLAPAQFTEYLKRFIHQHHFFNEAYERLKPLATFSTMHEALNYLFHKVDDWQRLADLAETLGLKVISDLLKFVLKSKRAGLGLNQIESVLFDESLRKGPCIDWLKQEISQLEDSKHFLALRTQQLLNIAFSYHAGDDVEQRLQSLEKANPHLLSREQLIACLNSYRSFGDKKMGVPESNLLSLKTILMRDEQPNLIMDDLNQDLIHEIVSTLVKQPRRHQNLFHQLLNSKHKVFCERQLRSQFKLLLGSTAGRAVGSFDQLSIDQIKSLSPTIFVDLVAITRLLAISNPLPELRRLSTPALFTGHLKEQQAFFADVSLFSSLNLLKKKANALSFVSNEDGNFKDEKLIKQDEGLARPSEELIQVRVQLDEGLQWLVLQSEQSPVQYRPMLDSIMLHNPAQSPLIGYHGLIWRAHLLKQPNLLIDNFLNWLNHLETPSSHEQPELRRLLQHIVDEGLIDTLCSRVLEAQALTSEQNTWLCRMMLSLDSFKGDALLHIMKISTWNGLESIMPDTQEQSCALINQSLKDRSYIKQILADENTRSRFLKRLTLAQCSIPQILDLLKKASDGQLKSLLSIHLLQRNDYLALLAHGNTLSNRLEETKRHTLSRLQPLLLMVDVNQLKPELIQSLTPEAAFSFLCSIANFHLWSEGQVIALLSRCPDPRVIQYWLNHYSTMPNAMHMMAHIFAFADTHIFEHLNKRMDKLEKKIIIAQIVRHISLLPTLKSDLIKLSDESHLILAIQLLMHEYQSPILVDYIQSLAKRLMSEKLTFSEEAMRWLLSLKGLENFKELNDSTTELINHYLKKQNPKVFYDGQQLVPLRVNCTLNLPQAEPVKAINYYLMHVQVEDEVLNQLLFDYLALYSTGELKNKQDLYSTSQLMWDHKSSEVVKNTLLNAFLQSPGIHDETIRHDIFKANATRAIRTYAQKGHYLEIIKLCDCAIGNSQGLSVETLGLAKKAKREATFEMGLSKMTGWFKAIRQWLKRCRFYRWHGLFIPNQSVHFLPLEDQPNVYTRSQNGVHLTRSAEEELSLALEAKDIEICAPALMRYNLTLNDSPEKEYTLRKRVDDFYEELLQQHKNQKGLESGFASNQREFLNNRSRLLELLLQRGNMKELRRHLTLFAEGPGAFSRVKAEFETQDIYSTLDASKMKGTMGKIMPFIKQAVVSKGLGLFSYFSAEDGSDSQKTSNAQQQGLACWWPMSMWNK